MRLWLLLLHLAALAPGLESDGLDRIGAADPGQSQLTRSENPRLRLVSWLNRKLPVTNLNAPLSLRDGTLAGLTTADAALKAVRDGVRDALESASPQAIASTDLPRSGLGSLSLTQQTVAKARDPGALLVQFLSGNRPAVVASAPVAVMAEPEAEATNDKVPAGLIAVLVIGALALLAAFVRSRAD